MATPVHILGISGSLRARSFNTAALRAAGELLPAGATLEIADLAGLPFYDGDLEAAGGFPPPVQALRARVAAADALLFATPEYNYSVSGALKNAIDWVSRPPSTPLDGKPAALLGAGGTMGTSRAQYHLRQILVHSNFLTLPKPEVYIIRAREKFDAEGTLTDPATREHLAALLVALVAWTRRLRGG
jgi:chromate reductase, NAD(P)H dehydrogenase (quinone)